MVLVRQNIPGISSVTRIHLRFEDPWFVDQDMPMELKFFGYRLSAFIKRAEQGCFAVAQPKPESLYRDMPVNLRFFPPHIQGARVGWFDFLDSNTIYQLFTHSLAPCSSWIVLREGRKVGVLCCDEVFGGMHRSQILEKCSLEPSPDGRSHGFLATYKLEFASREYPTRGQKRGVGHV